MKTNNDDSFFDEISSNEFKIDEKDIDVFIPHVQILFKKSSATMDKKSSQSMRELFMHRFYNRFKDYYSKEEFYVIPDFLDDIETANKVMDSILNKNIKVLPNSIRKYVDKNEKYSLITNFNGYHLKKRIDYNIFIFDNNTYEKVYYHYSVFPANFDNGKGMKEHEKKIFTRFLKQTTTQQ